MKKNEVQTDISQLSYEKLKPHLTQEEYELLSTKKPKTIYAASRIGGIRPSTLIYLHFVSGKRDKESGVVHGGAIL